MITAQELRYTLKKSIDDLVYSICNDIIDNMLRNEYSVYQFTLEDSINPYVYSSIHMKVLEPLILKKLEENGYTIVLKDKKEKPYSATYIIYV